MFYYNALVIASIKAEFVQKVSSVHNFILYSLSLSHDLKMKAARIFAVCALLFFTVSYASPIELEDQKFDVEEEAVEQNSNKAALTQEDCSNLLHALMDMKDDAEEQAHAIVSSFLKSSHHGVGHYADRIKHGNGVKKSSHHFAGHYADRIKHGSGVKKSSHHFTGHYTPAVRVKHGRGRNKSSHYGVGRYTQERRIRNGSGRGPSKKGQGGRGSLRGPKSG